MSDVLKREVARLERILAELYREGGYQKVAIQSLWARIEKAEIELTKEEARDGN